MDLPSNMSKIGVCGFFREHQFAGGAYSFLENLLRGFAEVRRSPRENDDFELTVFHGSQGIRWTDPQLRYRQLPDRWGRIPAEVRVGLRDSAGLDAVLFPNSFTPPIVRSRRVVTVIHDLQYLHLPKYWPLAKRLLMRTFHAVTLHRCDAVVVISQSVKNDLLEQYGARWESRVHAIWNPVSIERFSQPADQSFTNGRPYILSTGADRPAKNLAKLIQAFALLRERFPDYCLVLAGQLRSADQVWDRKSPQIDAETPSTVDLVNHLGLTKDVIVTGFISDEQLGSLYRGASLFVLPSLFEGFGMPAVEALALGTPTLVSDLPVLREVTLNGAHFIENPHDEHEIAARIADVLRIGNAARPSPEFCRDIRDRFAPETIARQYLATMLGE